MICFFYFQLKVILCLWSFRRVRECFLFETTRGSGEGADFHTDSTDCTASDFLVSSLHVFAACFWREQFCPCHADFPFLAGNRSAGAGIGTESTAPQRETGVWMVVSKGQSVSRLPRRTRGPKVWCRNMELFPMVPSPAAQAICLWEYRPAKFQPLWLMLCRSTG